MKILKSLWHRFTHKLGHFKWSYIKKLLKEHGLAFLVIFIIWEIIEDILFPILFVWLGTHVHPIFLAGVPVSWLLCFHWLTVPLLWGAWIRLKGKNNESR